MKTILSFIQKNRTVVLYGIIGISAVVVDYSFFALFYNFFGIHQVLSTVLSVGISTVYAFTLNRSHNFKTKDFTTSRFISYVVVSLIGMASSALIIEALSLLDVNPNIGKAISLPPIVVAQYFLNKHFTFNKKHVPFTKK